MLKEQYGRYNMFLSLQLHFNKNKTAWNTTVPIVNAYEKLNATVLNLQEALQLQLANNTGITVDKKTVRELLEMQTYLLISGAMAFAILTKNSELLLQTKYTITAIKKLRDTEIQSIATNIATNVEPVITDLAPYGITLDTLVTLRATIYLFSTKINKPKESAEIKKEATAKIAVLLKEISDLLKTQLDLLIIGLQPSQPEFVSKYKLLRRVRKPSRTKLSLITKVIDASTLLSIKGVLLKIVTPNIKRVSGANGINRIKNIMEGDHKLMVSHKDYKELVLEFMVVNGETTKLEIVLEALS